MGLPERYTLYVTHYPNHVAVSLFFVILTLVAWVEHAFSLICTLVTLVTCFLLVKLTILPVLFLGLRLEFERTERLRRARDREYQLQEETRLETLTKKCK